MAPPARTVAGRYWSAHTHTRHSKDDALTAPADMVDRGVELGYPAISFTDHGNMAHVVEAYQRAKHHGIPYGPGVEMYMTPLHEAREQRALHLTMIAYTGQGYRNLVGLHNQAHEQFHYRPKLDMADLAQAAEDGRTQGIAVATGCRSGLAVKALTDRGPDAATRVISALAGWFPRTYVELMRHGFKADGMHDDEITNELIAIAAYLGLPTMLTGDAHYALESDREDHDALKRLVSFDPETAEFSGSGYWLRGHDELDPFQEGFEGLDDLAAAMKVTIPELDTFVLKIPDVSLTGDPVTELTRMIETRSAAKTEGLQPKMKQMVDVRNADEVKVITATGMAPYLLLVTMICDFMEREGIWFYARGSVAGSRACYDLGISSTDPIRHDIRMDRFLSGDRTSVPDIDLDIEHGRRGELMAFLEEQGYELVQVGTQGTYGLAKREEDGEEAGSLMVKYFSTLKQLGDSETTWETAPENDKRMLFRLAERGLVAGVGAHPGGYVVARDKPTVASLPLVKIQSSGTVVTAFNKGEVEAMGYPKIDMLGSKVLTALKLSCMAATGLDEYGAREWFRTIPYDDKETLKRISQGRTTGLFQLGGWTNRKVCQQVKPKKTADIVAIQAIARPAPMKSGFTDEFLQRRDKLKPIPEVHQDIALETKDTYGLAIYQEQVVGMLRRIGVPPLQLTKLLKAVKASGKAHVVEARKIVAGELESVRGMAEARGWGPEDINYLIGCLVDYGAGYSFGKAHSVTYGVAAYDTAFMATHHPLEWWTGMLNAYRGSTAPHKKAEKPEVVYARAARDDGLRVKEPHVQTSGLEYVFDPEARVILKGLSTISGVGEVAARELIAKRPFESLVDLGQRVTGKVSGAKDLVFGARPDQCKGTILALFDHGALLGIPPGTPVRRPKGRIRKCKACKVTFPTPLEYEDHVEEVHGDV